MLQKLTILPLLFFSLMTWAQNGGNTLRLWRLTNLSGEIGGRGHYRWYENNLMTVPDAAKKFYLMGGLKMATESYLLSPKFLTLDVEGEFNPGTNMQDYIVSPDRSEVITGKKIRGTGTLFRGKPINLTGFGGIDHSFFNREYISSVKSYSRFYGSNFNWHNKILPVKVSYQKRDWDQTELETGRLTNSENKEFSVLIDKSFSSYDKHEFSYKYTYYYRDNKLSSILNEINNIQLNNHIYFDKRKRFLFRSRVSSFDLENYSHFNRFQANENLQLRISKNIQMLGNYTYFDVEQNQINYKQNNIDGSINHHLYESLRSQLNLFYNSIKHTAYEERNRRSMVNLNYTKKIPTGRLTVNYGLQRLHKNMDSQPVPLEIFNEEHILQDGEIVLLNNPYAEFLSLVVKNETGTIIYDKYLDYILIFKGAFLEIQRVPGGQISNNSKILVDYTAMQVGSFEYTSNNNSLRTNIVLFKQLLDLYHSWSKMGYPDEEDTYLITLNRFVRNAVGARVGKGFIKAGVEYDQYKSNIIPYNKWSYFIQLNGRIGKKATLQLNGDHSSYDFTQTNTEQAYTNFYGDITYFPLNNLRFTANYGIRKQRGDGLNLDLIFGRSEIDYSYRQIRAVLGVQFYKRDYLDRDLNFKGIYFNIKRLF